MSHSFAEAQANTTHDTKENKANATTSEPAQKPIRVVIGEPWPEDLEVTVEPPRHARKLDAKVWVALGFATIFGGILLAYAVYGLHHNNAQLLDKVWGLTTTGVAGVLGWALGRAKASKD